MASSSITTSSSDHHNHSTAPPPTPSSYTLSLAVPPPAADASLSNFLLQLATPSLSFPPPTRRHPRCRASDPPPTISLLHPDATLLTTAALQHGFFHLTDHGIPSQLPVSASQESRSPLGGRSSLHLLGFDDDEGEEAGEGGFLVMDADHPEAADSSLAELAREMGRVGVEVVGLLLAAAGLRDPLKDGSTRPRRLMWVSDDGAVEGRRYPYVVCLQYEMRGWRKCDLVAGDCGGPVDVSVATQPDSVLVSIGDIGQVWSNGRFKKVTGRPVPTSLDGEEPGCLTMSLLVTLPPENAVSPLSLAAPNRDSDDVDDGGRCDADNHENRFCSFPFEQYAWRLYHETLSFKDPLHRYRL